MSSSSSVASVTSTLGPRRGGVVGPAGRTVVHPWVDGHGGPCRLRSAVEDERILGWRDALAARGGPARACGAVELALAAAPTGWRSASSTRGVAAALLLVRRRALPLVLATLRPRRPAGHRRGPAPQLDEPAVADPASGVSLLHPRPLGARTCAGCVGLGADPAALMFVDYLCVDARHHDWTDVVFVLTLCVPPYVLGRVVRRLAAQKRAAAQDSRSWSATRRSATSGTGSPATCTT